MIGKPMQTRGTSIRSLSVLVLLCIGATHPQAVAQPQMVRWEILATVIEIEDPLGLFPDVRLGDPVRGMLKYDLTLFPNPLFSTTHDHYFTNEIWLDVARMVIENPREQTEYAFQTDVKGYYAIVDVFNDYPDDDGPFDGFYAAQSVIPPDGFQGPDPVVAVVLEGPPSVFSQEAHYPTLDDRPPSQLSLDDWPVATLVFWDAYAKDPTATSIAAEIYSLIPVAEQPLPGDYDYDGDVDAADYYGWQVEFGDDILFYTDGNRDGVTGAADYVVWRNALANAAGGTASADSAIPEPTTLIMLSLAAACGIWRRRAGRWGRGPLRY